MDPYLIKAISDKIPKITSDIAEGYAIKEFKYVESYVSSIIVGASNMFPPGLTYLGLRKLTPIEEFLKITESGGNNASIDISRSDVYMVNLDFEYQGTVITKNVYLPFVRDGGMLSLRGSSFVVSPVLVDKGMSLGSDTVFIQIPKARNMYKRVRYNILANGVRKTPNVPFSKIHNRSDKKKGVGVKLIKAETVLAHYLFAKYGVRETFKRFCGVDIKIGDTTTITEALYPKDQWVICTCSGMKPKGLKTKFYTPTELAVAIRECDYDLVTESLIAGLFYVVDLFSDRIKVDFIDSTEYELRLWRILLGLVVGGVTGGEGAILDDMNEHMSSLDSYVDTRAKSMLAEGDIFVNDFYELLYFVIETLANMVTQTTTTLSTMYGKQLVVLRYALNDINECISRLGFQFQKSGGKKELSLNDVSKIIKNKLLTDAVFKMNIVSKHGEVSSMSYSGDNKLFKITTNIVLQSDTGGNARGAKNTKIDSTKFLHSSIAEVGSYTVLPKSEPTGRSRINPWVKLDAKGSILQDPDKIDLLGSVQRVISR